jgi:hypothetical protein
MQVPANPHDAHIRLCWKICRFGMGRLGDEAVRRKVLAWIEGAAAEFPGSPHVEAWSRIFRGEEPGAVRELEATEDYFDLPVERRSWWRPIIQSHPFAPAIPGRTTRERREFLSRLS